MLSALLLMSSAFVVVPIKQATLLELGRPEIRVADIVDLHHIDRFIRGLVEERIIARTAPDRGSVTISRRSLAMLVRHAVPLLHPVEENGSITFTVRQAPHHRTVPCSVIVGDITRATPVTSTDFTAGPCPDKQPTGLMNFERRSGVLRASSNLKAGTRVGRIAPITAPAVEKGAGLTLVSRAGPIRVERPVIALQTGQAGSRIFVIDEDRNVTSVQVAPEPSAVRP